MARTKNTSIALVEDDSSGAPRGSGIVRKTKRQVQFETHNNFEAKYRDWVVGTIDALKASRADVKNGFKIG